jgi:nucleoside-diphosphate-sugar epimerase
VRVLIVGHTSMVGRHLGRILRPGHEVITCDRTGDPDIHLDLSDPGGPSRDARADVLIHLAASFAPDTPEGMLENERVNAAGAFLVADLARRAGCRYLLYTGTVSSFPSQDSGYRNSYSLSKRHGHENLELACGLSGIAFGALWMGQIYDAEGEAARHQPLLYRMLAAAAKGEEITLYGKADPLRNYLFAEDCAEILIRTLEARLEGTYPCLHPESLPLSRIAALASEAFGGRSPVRWHPEKPDIPPIPLPDGSALWERLGYRPATSLASGLDRIRRNLEAGGR